MTKREGRIRGGGKEKEREEREREGERKRERREVGKSSKGPDPSLSVFGGTRTVSETKRFG